MCHIAIYTYVILIYINVYLHLFNAHIHNFCVNIERFENVIFIEIKLKLKRVNSNSACKLNSDKY